MADLEKDFPSLKLGYEQIKDVLREQGTLTQNYISRAITLFSIATAIIGIGLPLLFTKSELPYNSLIFYVPVIVWAIIPLLIYMGVIVAFWIILHPEHLKIISNPKILLDGGFLELEPSMFYSEIIQDIARTFDENEKIVVKKQQDLIWLYVLLMLETMCLIIIVLLFFAFGFFG